jgi:hypothetical protein
MPLKPITVSDRLITADVVLGDLGGVAHRTRIRVRIHVRAALTAFHDEFAIRLPQHAFYCLDHDHGKERGKSV